MVFGPSQAQERLDGSALSCINEKDPRPSEADLHSATKEVFNNSEVIEFEPEGRSLQRNCEMRHVERDSFSLGVESNKS